MNKRRAARPCLLRTLAGSLLVIVSVTGCPAAEDASGQATGAVCDSALSYEADIAPLLANACTSCHAATLPTEKRHGAPTDHNFDSEAGLLENPSHVANVAAAGPDGANTAMPPAGSPTLTLAERRTLGSFLACYPDGLVAHTH